MTLREKVARALLASARSMKQVLPEWDDAARWRFPETGLTMQEVALAEADAALAVVREALNEAEQTMIKAMAEAQDSGTTDLDCLLAYAMEASPLSEGNGNG